MKFKVALLFYLIILSSFASAQKTAIQVTDMLKIKQISAIKLSPDGKRVVFSVTSIVTDNENNNEFQYNSHLYISNTEGEPDVRALTTGNLSASQPVWSPDGNAIAFVRLVKDRQQLFILSLKGGEPIQVTNHKYGVSSPTWSPDGKKILFSASIPFKELLTDSILNPGLAIPNWSLEKPEFAKNENIRNTKKGNPNGNLDEIRAYLSKNEIEKKAKVFNKLNFQEESTTNPEYNFIHYFIVDAIEGAKVQSLTTGFYSFKDGDFFKDGKTLIISCDLDSIIQPGRTLENGIYALSLLDKKLIKILAQPKVMFSNPVISPSGNFLAYQFAPTNGINIAQMAILNMKNPEKEPVIISVDRTKNNPTWSDDERFLYFTTLSNGASPLLRYTIKTKFIDKLTSDSTGVSAFSIGKDKLVYVKTEIANPFEVYTTDLSNKNTRQLTAINSKWLSEKSISFPIKKKYVNSKGQEIEYWVIKPLNFIPGVTYPLMLQIHGGPSSMWGPSETSMWHEFQYFASKGYGVVFANPRGSGGYGQDFLRANYQDWGNGPTEDVLGALDGTIAEGWVNTKKLVVTGGSYAGYLTAWIISHDTRFAAASSQRGVYDLSTFFGEGNAWRLVPDYFGGYPWEKDIRPILVRESPFNNVDKINTPYLIFHGENDLRTGVIQSEMMYKALKVLNKPVEYVRHPGATHELTRAGNVRQRMDQMLRIYEFFERYIKH